LALSEALRLTSAFRPDNVEIDERARGLRRRKEFRAASKKWFERHQLTPSRVGEDAPSL
jgi:hypothetical protein